MSDNSYNWPNPARRLRVPNKVSGARTIADLRLMARRRLPNFMYEYLEGGADSELTLRRNVAAPENWLWLPHMAIDDTKVDTASTLFGANIQMPVVIAPTGFNGMLWHRGDMEIAKAGAHVGIPVAQSTVSMNTIEEVASVPNIRHWFQLYAYGGMRIAERLLERAAKAGSEALVITIDGAAAGNRIWDQRSYDSPGQLSLRSKLDTLRHPHWLQGVILAKGPPNFVNLKEFVDEPDPDVYAVARWCSAHRPILTWEDITRIRKAWAGKLIIKGILRSDEAMKAAQLGADAIVLSNHGGRQAEPTIAPIEVLPEIRQALGPDFTIMVDGGFRTGGHIATALALGADAVLAGRAVLYGLAAGGEAGAARALAILESELRRTMALAGASNISELGPQLLKRV